LEGVFGTGGRFGAREDVAALLLMEGEEDVRADSPVGLPPVAVEIPAGGVGGSGDTDNAETDAEWAWYRRSG